MPKKIFHSIVSLLSTLGLFTVLFTNLTVCCLTAQAGRLLDGSVNENDVRKGPAGPAMNRNDINKNGDPFSGNVKQDTPMQPIDSQPGMFDVPNNQPPPPKQLFPLNAQDEGQPSFQNMNATPDNGQQPMQNPPQRSGTQTDGNPADPDADSQALQLAWDQWHHNVAQAVYQRYTTYSNMAFTKSPPLSVSVSYTVTKDCQVTNIRLTQKSPNFLFNTLILTVVKSLSGDQGLLTFPQGSHRMSVEKAGTFSVNYGIEGFKYLTGDKETVRQQQNMRR